MSVASAIVLFPQPTNISPLLYPKRKEGDYNKYECQILNKYNIFLLFKVQLDL